VLKKILPFAIAALMIPGVALAKGKPPTAGTHTNQGKAKVMYVLKGMVYAYVPATTSTPGSITIDVKSSNRHGKLLNGQNAVIITVGLNTKIELRNGVTLATIALGQPGDLGTVKVRAPRLAFKSAILSDVEAALQNHAAHMVTDWGPPTS
jgi:hypothetical protein